MDATNLIAYLPFDTSTTGDLCGGSWTAYNDPTIVDGAATFGGANQYLELDGTITLGGQDFTIAAKINLSSAAGSWIHIFNLWTSSNSDANKIAFQRNNATAQCRGIIFGSTTANFNFALDTVHHVEFDYSHAAGKVYVLVDGVLMATLNKTIAQTTFPHVHIGRLNYSNPYFAGTVDEFMIFDGVALHTDNFTPPTDDDYIALKFAFGTKAAQYLSFTGNAGCYAELPLDVVAGATTFTIEAKFSTTSTKSSSNNWAWGTIAGREISSFGKNDGALCVNDGKLCFWCSPASKGTAASNTQKITSSAVVNDGAIHEVAVVSSNGAIDLFCDGVNVAHADNVNAKITDAQTILIAYDSDSNSYLQMDLYELRLWNVARSADEIFSDIDGTEAGLQGWYIPSSDGLQDYSGNARHATLYGAPAY